MQEMALMQAGRGTVKDENGSCVDLSQQINKILIHKDTNWNAEIEKKKGTLGNRSIRS